MKMKKIASLVLSVLMISTSLTAAFAESKNLNETVTMQPIIEKENIPETRLITGQPAQTVYRTENANLTQGNVQDLLDQLEDLDFDTPVFYDVAVYATLIGGFFNVPTALANVLISTLKGDIDFQGSYRFCARTLSDMIDDNGIKYVNTTMKFKKITYNGTTTTDWIPHVAPKKEYYSY